ncbi:hypothetical protein AGLY_007503 [Aphis glycines]|uniref:Uncharacterized protein n=1 Tax=Aphis glycines TaxID=307491 RepID=A0A6G0TM76_APHGL|nr:hypothetical protein AGLY_007503 [Aphis glycines]
MHTFLSLKFQPITKLKNYTKVKNVKITNHKNYFFLPNFLFFCTLPPLNFEPFFPLFAPLPLGLGFSSSLSSSSSSSSSSTSRPSISSSSSSTSSSTSSSISSSLETSSFLDFGALSALAHNPCNANFSGLGGVSTLTFSPSFFKTVGLTISFDFSFLTCTPPLPLMKIGFNKLPTHPGIKSNKCISMEEKQ